MHCLSGLWGCRPVCLEGLLDIKAEHNAAKLVVGNTEVGIELKFKHAGYPVLVGTTHVPELNTIEVSQGRMHCCRLRDSLLPLSRTLLDETSSACKSPQSSLHAGRLHCLCLAKV